MEKGEQYLTKKRIIAWAIVVSSLAIATFYQRYGAEVPVHAAK